LATRARMKRGTPGHPKPGDLGRVIERPLPFVLGTLELLWHWTAQYVPAGDVGRYSDAAIEEACCWDGEPGRLVEALTSVGWLDVHPKHRLVVHDWPQHAEDAVHKVLARACKRFATGVQPKLGGLSDAEKARAVAAFALPVADEGTPALHVPPPAAGVVLSAAAGGPAVAVAVAVCTDPPLPPRFAGGNRKPAGTSGRGKRDALVRELVGYALSLGFAAASVDPDRFRKALRDGRPPEAIKGTLAEQRRDELVAAGVLDRLADWPPPGLSPFESRAGPHAEGVA
jgi:hypothetical protein